MKRGASVVAELKRHPPLFSSSENPNIVRISFNVSFAFICIKLEFEVTELASEINVHLEGNKVKFTWREYIQLAQIIWDKIKETSRECAGKEIEVKLPAKLSLISAAFALIGFKL